MNLTYKIGDATHPDVNGPYWILHGCNNVQAWGAGFVLALNKTFGVEDGSPMKEYWRWFDNAFNTGDFPPTLGDIQFVQVGNGNCVVNMITQKGCGPLYHKQTEIDIPFKYSAFRECLKRVVVEIGLTKQRPTIVSPRIGCGLALAEWHLIETIIVQEFKDCPVDYVVYDLPPKEPINELQKTLS